MEELLEESSIVVDEVCEKYGYSKEDAEGNDSLATVLKKAVPAMLKDSPKEDRELFYQMLRNTPIVVTQDLTREGLNALKEQYIGNVNSHIIDGEEEDLGEYGEIPETGAYISSPIIDENMEIQGKKSFLYVKKVSDKRKEFFGTEINVSTLIHELGHAWNSEKDSFSIDEEGILIARCGTSVFSYSFEKGSNGKWIKKLESVNGLFIEEGMNTIEEEIAMANYMGISLDEMKKEYRNSLVLNVYQGLISQGVEELLEKTSKSDLKNWRLHGDEESKNKIENLMEKTVIWKNREEYTFNRKKKIFSKIEDKDVREFFERYEKIYFSDVSKMTPLQKIDNVLEQFYTLHGIELRLYELDPEVYKQVRLQIAYEMYFLLNETGEIKAKSDIQKSVENVRVSEVDEVNFETQKAIEKNKTQEKEIQGDSRDEL